MHEADCSTCVDPIQGGHLSGPFIPTTLDQFHVLALVSQFPSYLQALCGRYLSVHARPLEDVHNHTLRRGRV